MRTNHLAAVALAMAGLAVPLNARAWVVVRAAPVYYAPRPVVVVAPAPVVVVAPPPVYYPPPPPPPPNPLTTYLPINTTMWALPPGCNAVSVAGNAYYQCGVNWMRPFEGANGIYYSVVPPP